MGKELVYMAGSADTGHLNPLNSFDL